MKKRLDQILMDRQLFPSREKARSAIMTGRILIKGQKEMKAGTMVPEDVAIEIIGKDLPYVSRGGLKLEKAIDTYHLDFNNKIVLDIGASTGGFTDCSLQNGAAKVYSVDVGYGQLAWSLRSDERVVVLEKTNARYLTTDQVPELVDYIVIDASFISQKKLIPNLIQFMKEEACFVTLIKPQFEAGREKVGKKGVVRDPAVHEEVINDLVSFFYQEGLGVRNLTFSPIKGPEGNREYLVILEKGEQIPTPEEISHLVKEAFETV
ncbi:MAG: TlyA family RNA methyltransferase [Bacillota bacterium]|nr:TlyA family RNA methyltransferase [Bacillota bacterium]